MKLGSGKWETGGFECDFKYCNHHYLQYVTDRLKCRPSKIVLAPQAEDHESRFCHKFDLDARCWNTNRWLKWLDECKIRVPTRCTLTEVGPTCYHGTSPPFPKLGHNVSVDCPLTIHGLLHITWSIKVAGPVWTYWAFAMECHCNTLLCSIKSRCHPYASIAFFVTVTTQLDQIRLFYNLYDELFLDPEKKEDGKLIHKLCAFH